MATYKIPEYRSTTLVQHIADTINKRSEIKYCFILGAGASKSSGISTGYELSKIWFEDIKRIFPDDYQVWIKDNKINKRDLAKYYGKIYKKRFEINPIEGYEFLQKEMAASSPSFGYSILSQLLETQHNVVITTNFDSLSEDALFLYSENKPLICGHESLSEFVKPTTKRSIIIKVHRDLLLNPKNEDGELLELEKGFAESLDRIFQAYTPIVIGYGGNDLSLMNYLSNCNSLKTILWCKRTGDNLSNEIRQLLKDKKGKIFEIAGYDELMFQIYAELFKHTELDKKVQIQADKRANDWARQLVELSKSFVDKESKESLNKIIKENKYDNWWDVELAADAEENQDAKNNIYLEGLKELDDSSELNCNYAIFLDNIKKDYQNAKKYYLKAINLQPDKPLYNSNYANFLRRIEKDFDQAEKYYLKALELAPNDIKYIVYYATFLAVNRKDYKKAEVYYLKALEINPDNALSNINYIQLLIRFDRKEEAKMHIDRIFSSDTSEINSILLAELWLYAFANFYKEFPNAKNELDKIIAMGAKSPGWDFEINIKKAKEQKHPEIDKVLIYAEKISGNKYS